MKSLLFLSLLVFCVGLASAQLDPFGGIFQAASSMFSQALNMCLNMMQKAFDLIPFDAFIEVAKEMMTTAKDFPSKVIEMLKQAASATASAAGGVAGQGTKILTDAVKDAERLQAADAPNEAYIALLQKMKETSVA